MKKQLVIIGIVAVLVSVGFSGCTQTKNDTNSEDDILKQTVNEEQLKDEFESVANNIAKSIDTVTEVKNYNESLFIQHKQELYNHDDICELDYSYKDARDYIIAGLENLVNKEYDNSYSSFLRADNSVIGANSYTGDMWPIQFGFENGVCYVLWNMGYKP